MLGAVALFTQPWEGREYVAYWDDLGKVWTVCDGDTHGVTAGMVETPAGCDARLKANLISANNDFERLVKYPVPDVSRIAFIDFIFNVGAEKFRNSTMLKKINAGDLRGACGEFMRWTYAGGRNCADKVNKCYGIYLRRVAETKQCMAGVQ